VGPERHRALGLRRDGERRVDAEVRRDGRAVEHVQAVVAVEALPRVHDTGVDAVADRAATDDVRGHRDVRDLTDRPTGDAVDAAGDPTGHVVAGRNPGRVGLAVPR